MANPCSSGIAQPKPGVGVIVALTSTAASLLLERRGYGWLSALLGFLTNVSVDPTDFCQNGQPELPDFTATDANAMLNLFPPDELATAIGKIKDIVLHYLWYDICDCVGGTTTPPSTPQAPIDVTGYGSIGTDPCLENGGLSNEYTKTEFGSGRLIAELDWGIGANFSPSTGEDNTVTVRRVHWTVHRTRGATGTHEDPFFVQRRWTQAHQGSPQLVETVAISGDDYDETVDVPSGYSGFAPWGWPTTENAADTLTGTAEGFCDVPPTQDASGCCPTDANIIAALAQLQEQLAITKTQVDLIQRQSVPFAYVEGDSHSGLSGNGHFVVSGLIGIRVVLTSFPDWLGYEVGDTFEYFTESWINFSTSGVSSPRQWIRGSDQAFFPRNAGVYNLVSYSLKPGLTATIIELIREP